MKRIFTLVCFLFPNIVLTSDTMLVDIKLDESDQITQLEVPSTGSFADIGNIYNKKMGIPANTKFRFVSNSKYGRVSPDEKYTRSSFEHVMKQIRGPLIISFTHSIVVPDLSRKRGSPYIKVLVGSTVADLLDAYKKDQNLPQSTPVTMVVNGKNINDMMPIEEFETLTLNYNYGVRITLPEVAPTITLYNAEENKSHTMEYNRNDTIQDIIEKYREKTGLGYNYELMIFENHLAPTAKAGDVLKKGKTYYITDFVKR